MNVIRRSILDKINEEIDNNSGDIVRIELTNKEYSKFLKELYNVDDNKVGNSKLYINGKLIEMVVCEEDNTRKTNSHGLRTKCFHYDYSGSYTVYRGICVQTHEDYT